MGELQTQAIERAEDFQLRNTAVIGERQEADSAICQGTVHIHQKKLDLFGAFDERVRVFCHDCNFTFDNETQVSLAHLGHPQISKQCWRFR